MTLGELSDKVITPTRRKAILEAIRKASGENPVAVTDASGSAPAMMLHALDIKGVPMLVIGDSADDAGYLYHDLVHIAGEEAVAIFPSGYKRHIKYGQPDGPSRILRTEALSRWWTDSSLRFIVTYPDALAEKVASRNQIDAHTLSLSLKKQADMTEVTHWLLENGFNEVDYVYEPGQFAVRGSIMDIFGFSHELPYRLDFFGDDIDSIRTFNIETQLSEQKLEEVTVTSTLDEQSRAGISVMEFMPQDTIVAIRDASFTEARIREIAAEHFSASAAIAEEGDSDSMQQVVEPDMAISTLNKFRQIRFTAGAMPDAGCSVAISLQCSPQSLYHKNFDMISSSFKQLIDEKYSIYILSDSEKQIERLRAIFADRGDSDITFTPVIPTLHQGFSDKLTKICVFTDHQIFDRFHKYNLKSERARSGKLALSLKELQQIEPGDYIVHTDHGIGRFAGLLRTAVNGRTQEMIKLVYANDDIIFVSIHALHKLAKYRGKEGVPPKVNKLGSGAWNKMKERTKSRLKDIARDLIKLYAARREEGGFAFSPDSYLQHELEASFIYEDTPDQISATQAVKADMERPRPMDRLICGDVGFGKTEIAIRAAFKAATDGKQTAVLVPTTVLAYQHYNTFRERLKDFPVRVDYLSRARTPKQVREIIEDLKTGKIDILIGTHKLIGKQVEFKDLGLLVVDEEQKFGVAVKEKLKQIKVNVDTLTMSATPIPRTLQFSLMGARDLSNISTPPANRHPILTSVNTLNDDILAEAINFEMSRNGQIFIVNNRIEGLNQLQEQVKRLVPDARVLVAHGQMPPEKLEKAILDFANHDYDVLIATTIIESGIDMPNVNTIIINNAHRFGLSELHQLRGRVGRSSRKAFCYLMVPPGDTMTPDARRRLQAIESFSDLGSGIHIAMQDLDIRGAGNLLGAEQSGFIADLGYETYQKILKEAVTELRTEEFAHLHDENGNDEDSNDFVADCVIESDMELLLPAHYVPQEGERIALYQELDSIEREMDLQAFRMRLTDRFGQIPRVTEELLRIPSIRRMARKLGIEKVSLKQGDMFVYFVGDDNKAYYQSPMFGRMVRYLQMNPARVKIRENGCKRSFRITTVPDTATAAEIFSTILSLAPA